AYGAFARALASRYSGTFLGLPRVRHFEAWNEPNLWVFLWPQWEGRVAVGAQRYRRLLNAFEEAVHAVRADNVVIAGATAPYGDDPPNALRTRPLRFLRQVLCLKKKKSGRLAKADCRRKASFDVLSHHPINLNFGPRRSAIHPDDATTPDLKHVGRTLRAAERLGTVDRGRHRLWVTEIWWESNPPDPVSGVSLARQARRVQESLYVLWKQGARTVINYVLRDGPFDPDHPTRSIDSGLYAQNGSPKPALTAFTFPFVAERRTADAVFVWGRSPTTGRVVIEQRRSRGWTKAWSKRVRAGTIFTSRLELRGAVRLRASVDGRRSLNWSVR
ncbi:MAG: hypothetical protein ACRDNL_13275, partial [Spirillospora sp.]